MKINRRSFASVLATIPGLGFLGAKACALEPTAPPSPVIHPGWKSIVFHIPAMIENPRSIVEGSLPPHMQVYSVEGRYVHNHNEVMVIAVNDDISKMGPMAYSGALDGPDSEHWHLEMDLVNNYHAWSCFKDGQKGDPKSTFIGWRSKRGPLHSPGFMGSEGAAIISARLTPPILYPGRVDDWR